MAEKRAPSARIVFKKPAKLQLNNSGAWKDVVRFDAASTEDTDAVTDAAEALGNVPNNRVTFRLVKDDGTGDVLMHWSAEHGWKAVRHG